MIKRQDPGTKVHSYFIFDGAAEDQPKSVVELVDKAFPITPLTDYTIQIDTTLAPQNEAWVEGIAAEYGWSVSKEEMGGWNGFKDERGNYWRFTVGPKEEVEEFKAGRWPKRRK